ncbi:hypothetical protein RMQ97_09035, partial [Maricaulis sp. D1M11]|uniref:hypothetical protein n=1 Tax=Maricaulis sp. D1M11 TaxID=3076117 RepID=UPI0039B5B430
QTQQAFSPDLPATKPNFRKARHRRERGVYETADPVSTHSSEFCQFCFSPVESDKTTLAGASVKRR